MYGEATPACLEGLLRLIMLMAAFPLLESRRERELRLAA